VGATVAVQVQATLVAVSTPVSTATVVQATAVPSTAATATA
jgi:hypothetical protein